MKKEKLSRDHQVQKVSTKILCPLPIVKMRQQYNVTQYRLLVALLTKLQPVVYRQFQGLKSERKDPFLPDELIDGYVVVDLPLSLVTGKGKDYRNIRNSLMKMTDSPVEIAVGSSDHPQWHVVEKPLFVRFPDCHNGSHAYVYLYHTLANQLFDVSKGYFFFDRTTFQACTRRSTQQLYLLCERWRRRHVVNQPIGTVTRLLLATNSYRRFPDFRRCKLEVARNELTALFKQHKSTCYFTYQPVYQGSNIYGEPVSIIFRIYTAEDRGAADCMQLQLEVAQILRNRFHLYDVPVKRLSERIDQWNYPAVIEKMQELYHRYSYCSGIQDKRAYAYAVIDKVIKAYSPEQAVEQELPLVA